MKTSVNRHTKSMNESLLMQDMPDLTDLYNIPIAVQILKNKY